MLRFLMVAFWIIPAMAFARTYLPEPDLPTATARSVQESIAEGVQDGSPWWAVTEIPSGGVAASEAVTPAPFPGGVYIVIEDAPRAPGYDFTATPDGHDGLTAQEQQQLVPAATMVSNGALPSPVAVSNPVTPPQGTGLGSAVP